MSDNLLLQRFGYDSTFYVGGGLIVVAAGLVQWWLTEPEESKHPPKRSKDEPGFFDRRLWSAGVVAAAIATLSMAIGPLLAGLLAPLSFALPFVISGGLALAGGMLVWIFARALEQAQLSAASPGAVAMQREIGQWISADCRRPACRRRGEWCRWP